MPVTPESVATESTTSFLLPVQISSGALVERIGLGGGGSQSE